MSVAPRLSDASYGNPALLVLRYGANGAVFVLLALLLVRLPHPWFAQYRRQAYTGAIIAAAGVGLRGLAEFTGATFEPLGWLGLAVFITGFFLFLDLLGRAVRERVPSGLPSASLRFLVLQIGLGGLCLTLGWTAVFSAPDGLVPRVAYWLPIGGGGALAALGLYLIGRPGAHAIRLWRSQTRQPG